MRERLYEDDENSLSGRCGGPGYLFTASPANLSAQVSGEALRADNDDLAGLVNFWKTAEGTCFLYTFSEVERFR